MDECMRFAICRAEFCTPAMPMESTLQGEQFHSTLRLPGFQVFVIGAQASGSIVNGGSAFTENLAKPFGIHLARVLDVPNNQARSAVAKSIASPVISPANPVRGPRSVRQNRLRFGAFIVISPTTIEPKAGGTCRPADLTPTGSSQRPFGYMWGVD